MVDQTDDQLSGRVSGNSTWFEGDWDGDRDFTTSDLVLLFQQGGFEQDDAAPARAELLVRSIAARDPIDELAQPEYASPFRTGRPLRRHANPSMLERRMVDDALSTLDLRWLDEELDESEVIARTVAGDMVEGDCLDEAIESVLHSKSAIHRYGRRSKMRSGDKATFAFEVCSPYTSPSGDTQFFARESVMNSRTLGISAVTILFTTVGLTHAQAPEPASGFKQIAALEPLLGFWRAESDLDERGGFGMLARWASNKSYLQLQFTARNDDQRMHVGTVMIGQDATTNKLMMWGFWPDQQSRGEATVGDNQVSWSSSGTLAQGQTSADATLSVSGDELKISVTNVRRGGEDRPDMTIRLQKRRL